MVKKIILKDHEEWLKNRSRIGGSDASAILGLNPYKNNIELWMNKTGRVEQEDISDRPYVKYGTLAEPHLRELFKLDHPEFEVFYEENNMFLNDLYPFAHASLDGWMKDKDGRNGILEIKTTNIMQSMQKEKWKDRIPDNYYLQILHYFMVTEYDFAILKAQLKYEFPDKVFLKTEEYRIERSEAEEDIDFLARNESAFWEYVQSGKKPPLVLPTI